MTLLLRHLKVVSLNVFTWLLRDIIKRVSNDTTLLLSHCQEWLLQCFYMHTKRQNGECLYVDVSTVKAFPKVSLLMPLQQARSGFKRHSGDCLYKNVSTVSFSCSGCCRRVVDRNRASAPCRRSWVCTRSQQDLIRDTLERCWCRASGRWSAMVSRRGRCRSPVGVDGGASTVIAKTIDPPRRARYAASWLWLCWLVTWFFFV